MGAQKPCSHLHRKGPILTSYYRTRVFKDLDVHGVLEVNTPHVTIDDVCVTLSGPNYGIAIELNTGARGTRISHTTIEGTDTSSGSLAVAVLNEADPDPVITSSYFRFCDECIRGTATLNDSYVNSNGGVGTYGNKTVSTLSHVEDVFIGNAASFKAHHDVLLNPWAQTAVIFQDSRGVCGGRVTITDSLLAGGNLTLWGCRYNESYGSEIWNVVDNHFARCRTGPLYKDPVDGGVLCAGNPGPNTGFFGPYQIRPRTGADSHGYFPNVGFSGPVEIPCGRAHGDIFAGNVFDDDGAPVACS